MTAAALRPALFHQLIASRPQRERSLAATLASFALHAALITLLVWASTRVSEGVRHPEIVPEPIVLISDPTTGSEPQRSPQTPPHSAALPPTLSVPNVISPELPPIDKPTEFVTPAPDAPSSSVPGSGTPGGNASPDITAGNPDRTGIFTPVAVLPELKNRAAVQSTLERNYPALLRDIGIGGTVLIWLLVDEVGKVMKTELKTSSGYSELDEAALRVGASMRFSPALNRNQPVKVWVAVPVVFRAR
jgi:protein TonB